MQGCSLDYRFQALRELEVVTKILGSKERNLKTLKKIYELGNSRAPTTIKSVGFGDGL